MEEDLFQNLLDELEQDEMNDNFYIDAMDIPREREQEQVADNPIPKIAPIEFIEVDDFDEKNNLIDPEVRERIKNQQFIESPLFTPIRIPTKTIGGYFANVRFMENELINLLEPNEHVVQLRCNFGIKTWAGWTPPVKPKASNRGRKKKEKIKKPRKCQGTGTEFNSQLTFVIPSAFGKEHKFKVYRPGQVQLPGARPETIDEILEACGHISRMLNEALHPGEEDPAKLVRLINLNHVMKNYKYRYIMASDEFVKLTELMKVIYEREPHLLAPDTPTAQVTYPRVTYIKYSGEDNMLFIVFATPIPKDVSKICRVNIFKSGKIGFLGAYHTLTAQKIYDYILALFTHNRARIIAKPYSEPPPAPLLDNIVLRELTEANWDFAMGWRRETERILARLTPAQMRLLAEVLGIK